MGIKRLLCVLLSCLVLAACTAWQQGVTPGVTEASPTPGDMATMQAVGATGHTGHLIPLGVRPDAKCPHQFLECVTISPQQSAQLYFCYSPGSYCGGPSQYQYTWTGFFTDRQGYIVPYFKGSFNPNPCDPTYDTISEAQRVKPTHGYQYEQWICPWQSEICQGYFYVGIAVK
jgi:hypothetical protein